MVPADSPFFIFFMAISSIFCSESCFAHPLSASFSAVAGLTHFALSVDFLITLTKFSAQMTWSAVKSNFICCLGLITSAKDWDANVLEIKIMPRRTAK